MHLGLAGLLHFVRNDDKGVVNYGSINNSLPMVEGSVPARWQFRFVCVLQYPVMEYFLPRQIGCRDVDVDDQGVTSIRAVPADISPITAASAKPSCAKIAST